MAYKCTPLERIINEKRRWRISKDVDKLKEGNEEFGGEGLRREIMNWRWGMSRKAVP